MLKELLDRVFRFISRIIGSFFAEIIVELLIRGVGYYLVKPFHRSEPDVNGAAVTNHWHSLLSSGWDSRVRLLGRMLSLEISLLNKARQNRASR